jgi:integrase
MRTFKPSYSKALPEGAKILKRKDGRWVQFRNKHGELVEGRLTKKGDRVLMGTELWHIEFLDNRQIKRDIVGFTDKGATETLGEKVKSLLYCQANRQAPDLDLQKWLEKAPLQIQKQFVGFGLLDGQRIEVGKMLSEFLDEYVDFLTKKELTPRHIKETAGTLRRIFRDCGFLTWMDISPDRLITFLDGLRDGGRGISKRRYSSLLGAAKTFCRWMVKQRKALSSPIDYLDGLPDSQTDIRHAREPLNEDDLLRFLEATAAGPEKFGLTGAERNFIYRFAIETALRSIDLRRLRVRDCNFTEHWILIQAGRTKNKKRTFVYLKPETSIELQQYCANKLLDTAVFHLPYKPVDMVRFDLANTNPAIPYVNENGAFFDFHCLKHQSASMYAANPETPEIVRQDLTHHATPEMARRYSHPQETSVRKAVEAGPDLRRPSRQKQLAAKTGTDFLSISCFTGGQIAAQVDAGG